MRLNICILFIYILYESFRSDPFIISLVTQEETLSNNICTEFKSCLMNTAKEAAILHKHKATFE